MIHRQHLVMFYGQKLDTFGATSKILPDWKISLEVSISNFLYFFHKILKIDSKMKILWTKTKSANFLAYFLFVEAMNLRKYARYPWAAMSHLTPTKWNVFFRPNSGMRELSDSISRNVSFRKIIIEIFFVIYFKPKNVRKCTLLCL